MIDITDPTQLDALMVRVQARRVAQCYQGAGRNIPPLAERILADDTEERVELDAVAYAEWCAASRGGVCPGARRFGLCAARVREIPRMRKRINGSRWDARRQERRRGC
jgi:hypothetical protein